jgi:hypothetical protein
LPAAHRAARGAHVFEGWVFVSQKKKAGRLLFIAQDA